ncbi:MAG: lipopolysaccharide heptosyltransferase II [Lentisphaeria bacterium]|nr:lipopolysaccharide heptosyltransferase II [Lentisphaeria bacterium]
MSWDCSCAIWEASVPYKPELRQLQPPAPRINAPNWRDGLLLRSTNWLGDLLMTLPAAYQLKRSIPEACGLFVLTPAALADIWLACPWVDVVIPMQGKRISKTEIQRARSLNPGMALVLPNSFGAALDIYRCAVPLRIGRRGRGRSLLLNHRLPEWKRGENTGKFHQLSYYLHLVSSLGDVRLETNCPPLRQNPELAAQYCINKNGRWLALAPGAAYGPAKQWPPQYYSEIARRWQEQGGKLVLLGTKKELAAGAEIAAACPKTLNLIGKTDMATLMSILANVQAIVANDSGVMHLGAALGARGIAIFGSTDPIATGPIGGKWKLEVSQAQCRPCFKRFCPLPEAQKYHCLHQITPQQVYDSLCSIVKPD